MSALCCYSNKTFYTLGEVHLTFGIIIFCQVISRVDLRKTSRKTFAPTYGKTKMSSCFCGVGRFIVCVTFHPGYRLLMPMVICDHVSLQTVNVLPAALYVGS